VAVGKVVRKTMPLDLRVIGPVEPAQAVEIRGQITGQLTSVGFKGSDDVTQGDVLFIPDRRPLEAARAAEANLQRRRAIRKRRRRSASPICATRIVSKDQLDTSKAAAAALRDDQADRAAVENARIQIHTRRSRRR
jgi:multidrug efflux system membrane fusion protein